MSFLFNEIVVTVKKFCMIKRILISSDGKNIVRTAFVNGKNLINFDIDCIDTNSNKYNIYKGYVTRIESSLNAVFVDYGEVKQGFLPFREISSYYFKNGFNVSKNDSVLVQGTLKPKFYFIFVGTWEIKITLYS
jgi:ribonuclease E